MPKGRARPLSFALGGAVLAALGLLSLGVHDPARGASPQGAEAAGGPGRRMPDSFADLVEEVKGSVVDITFTGPGPTPRRRARGESPHVDGSGLIIDADGYVVTNDHLLERARTVIIHLSDDEEYEARVVGRDAWTDVALLKIQPARPLPAAVLGDSDRVRVGDRVLAMGNAFGLGRSVTAGVVSAKGRVIGQGPDDDFIQNDAATNPGSSGGPLFNTRGEVIGIHSMGYGEIAQSAGVGLAIPINLVKEVVAQLKANGRITRGSLGIAVQPVPAEVARRLGRPTREGALVATVDPKGPGSGAGLRPGDVVVAFQGQPVQRAHALGRLAAKSPLGSAAEVTIVRGTQTLNVKVTITELRGRPSHNERRIGHQFSRVACDGPRGHTRVRVAAIAPPERACSPAPREPGVSAVPAGSAHR